MRRAAWQAENESQYVHDKIYTEMSTRRARTVRLHPFSPRAAPPTPVLARTFALDLSSYVPGEYYGIPIRVAFHQYRPLSLLFQHRDPRYR